MILIGISLLVTNIFGKVSDPIVVGMVLLFGVVEAVAEIVIIVAGSKYITSK